MYCKPKVNNGSVVIYYGVNGVMRFPTGIKISKVKSRNNKFKEWDYKNNRVRNEVKNSSSMNSIIARWLKSADDIVTQYFHDDIKITAPELQKELTKIKEGKAEVKSSLFLDHYKVFYEQKREQIIEREQKSDDSFRAYGTFKSTIEDYEAEHDTNLKISDTTNTEWLIKFHSWLLKERPKKINLQDNIYIFKTKGKLKPRSIDKRFETLSLFFNYLKPKGFIQELEFLKNYKRNEITITPKIKTTLTIDEIHQLYDIKYINESKEKVKLLFLLSCLTGFRWKDLERFDKEFVTVENGGTIYTHIPSKTKYSTGKTGKVPLCKLALKILDELNYNLKMFSNGYTNRTLKSVLAESNLFNDRTLAEERNTGRKLKRYELLSMHRGRDTFITNLIPTVPLHELMHYTNHEKISTLQKYIDHLRDINPGYVSIFDRNV